VLGPYFDKDLTMISEIRLSYVQAHELLFIQIISRIEPLICRRRNLSSVGYPYRIIGFSNHGENVICWLGIGHWKNLD